MREWKNARQSINPSIPCRNRVRTRDFDDEHCVGTHAEEATAWRQMKK